MTEHVAVNLLSVPTQLLADELLTDILVRPGCRNDQEFALAPGEHLKASFQRSSLFDYIGCIIVEMLFGDCSNPGLSIACVHSRSPYATRTEVTMIEMFGLATGIQNPTLASKEKDHSSDFVIVALWSLFGIVATLAMMRSIDWASSILGALTLS